MKKIQYQINAKISPEVHLHYNTYSNQFILLNEKKHKIFTERTPIEIKNKDPKLYQTLIDTFYLIPENFDEIEVIKHLKHNMQYNSSLYQIMINTTLDCNLRCWYCYENLIPGSQLKNEVIEAIKKNIDFEYTRARFNTLKLSFFGGEPFLYFKGIKKVLEYAYNFCKNHNIILIADFTTNATLINQNHIDFLKKFRCHFQITLDGDRKTHNTIKKDLYNVSTDNYKKTLDVLQSISTHIKNYWVAIRINFDNHTLEKIDEIISDIDFMNRKYSYIILKKIWQIPKDKIDRSLLHVAIQKFIDKEFLVDYYLMPKGHICFAERNRHVLINYDGQIFKCSTISSFNEKDSLAKLNFNTGEIVWDLMKSAYWLKDITPQQCIECPWFPACLGPCNKQLLTNRDRFLCTFDSINMNTPEFLMYLFKLHLLKLKLNHSE